MITAHVYQLYIRADLDSVWNAIVDPAFTRQYFFGSAFENSPQPGPYRSVLADGTLAVEGVIEEFDPPRRLVQTWQVRYDEAMAVEPASRVTWTLEPAGEGLVRLRVVHGDLAFSPLTWANVKDGWVYVLDGLKSLVETGAPLPALWSEDPVVEAEAVAKDWHRMQGVDANNAVWGLLATEPFDAEAALRTAYAAAYHWERAASRQPVNEIRACYMIGKVWLAAGLPELALESADRMAADCSHHQIADFDLAYTHELRARALKTLGRVDEARAAWALATAVPIAEDEDRAILASDFADFEV